MKRQPNIVIIGSSNTDLVIQCSQLPKPGETILGGEFSQSAGSKGANQAVAAARAGAKVTFIGAHGADDFGREAKAGLRREGIDVRYFRRCDAVPSGVALILLGGKSRQNMIAVARSANNTFSADDVLAARSAFRKAQVVVASLEIPLEAVEAAARLATESNVPFVLNPAPARRLSKTLLRLVHTIIPNEHEAEELIGESKPPVSAQRLLSLGCANVVVTLGSRGAIVVNATDEQRIKAPVIAPVDTVGAGDCFTAWLSVGIAEGLSVHSAADRAVRAASLPVTRAGAQAGMPFRKEIEYH